MTNLIEILVVTLFEDAKQNLDPIFLLSMLQQQKYVDRFNLLA